MAGCDISFCPTNTEPSANSAAKVILSSVQIAGRTRDPSGIRATRENRKIAASKERKNVRAPAKKKFPTEPERKLNLSVECRRIFAWKWTKKARIVCLYGSETPCRRNK